MKPGVKTSGLRKFLRFAFIYGPGRTVFKAAGRLRIRLPSWRITRMPADVGLIGCGQFAFATIGYFLQARFGRRVLVCFDIQPLAAASLARALGVPHVAANAQALLDTPGLRTVYIASNHASHAAYATQALARGLDVYVEKPVAVELAQLRMLCAARRSARGQLFAGYNRPFSAAVRALRKKIKIDLNGGFSLQCCVVGHVLDADHWYRRPEEGTRVCGNVGHWLDLFVHILHWRCMPQRLDIALTWADTREPDDNLCIAIGSDRGDLCTITLTARAEPFEGINESIQLQHGSTICKIDDFRRMTLWQGERVMNRHFWPKDPGHRGAILQPFDRAEPRAWEEVEDSTLLMLHITEMVRSLTRTSTFLPALAREELLKPLASGDRDRA